MGKVACPRNEGKTNEVDLIRRKIISLIPRKRSPCLTRRKETAACSVTANTGRRCLLISPCKTTGVRCFEKSRLVPLNARGKAIIWKRFLGKLEMTITPITAMRSFPLASKGEAKG